MINEGYHKGVLDLVGCKDKSGKRRCMLQAQAADSATSVGSSAIAASFSSMLLRTSGSVSRLTFLGLQKEIKS